MLMILESATSGQSFQVQSIETFSEWLDLHNSFLSNTSEASVPNEMLQKLVLFFAVTYGHTKKYSSLY